MLVQGWHGLKHQSPLPNGLQPFPDLTEILPNTFFYQTAFQGGFFML
jgi:hypothetical protein